MKLYARVNGVETEIKTGDDIQVSTIPTAAADLEGKIVQFIGTTTGSYTNGYFYKCVEGSTSGTYEWVNIDIMDSGDTNVQSNWNQTDDSADDYIKNKPTLGTAAALDVPATGNASSSEVVKGNDSRLSDSRTPTAHTHTKSEITDFPTLGTAAVKNSTNAVTSGSTALVESGAVHTAVAAKQNKITQSSALTLTVAGWDSTAKTQTVTYSHDTAKRNVIDITISELETWANCGVMVTGETASNLTFKCNTIPESALTFKVCSMSVN